MGHRKRSTGGLQLTEYPIPDHIEPKEFTLDQMKALCKTPASMRPVTYERALQEMIKRFETLSERVSDAAHKGYAALNDQPQPLNPKG